MLHGRYQKLRKVGSGTYGNVYQAKDTYTQEIVAVKKIKSVRPDAGIPQKTIREVSILSDLNHPHVIRLLAWETPPKKDSLSLILEYLPCDLRKTLDTRSTLLQEGANPNAHFTPRELKTLMYHLLSGTAYCHGRRIIHRDLRPANLLVNRSGSELKVADFGLARVIIGEEKVTPDLVTLWYRAPEILLGDTTYSSAVDIWSVACIFAEMTNLAPLFPGQSEIEVFNAIVQTLGRPKLHGPPSWENGIEQSDQEAQQAIDIYNLWEIKLQGLASRNSIRPQPVPISNLVPHLDSLGQDLLSQMLQLHPAHRIPAKKALEHPWFDEVREHIS